MVKVGMMIGDRYEILEKIGTGGMSDVYKAKCHKLNRFVAVKVLKQEFSENANFVSKFQIEAQAAAGLMHSNIVNVYDVGEENGIYYIVMELVEGITLKKYIEKKQILTYKEAVSIAIQISMGIEAAHNNHIIHRDIKPQNIIISKEGKVKVTDFGIAKAATSNTITSNVMGSVHYTSPEQARGGYSDEKSDIYSLGITMFEMLTGRVPFNGETTVAIAIKHIQEEMIPLREIVEDVPASVESIVLKCCQKSPDRRYQSMAELIADLKYALMNPEVDFVAVSDPYMEAGTRTVSEEELVQIKRKTVSRDAYEEQQMRLNGRQSPVRQNTGRIYVEQIDEVEDDFEDEDPRMERVTTALAIIAGIIICIIILVLLGKIIGFFDMSNIGGRIDASESTTAESNTASPIVDDTQVKEQEMIDVSGWKVADAKAALERIKLKVELTYVESSSYAEGTVINASINDGEMVAEGTTVTLTVSSGVTGVLVPDVEDKTYEAAYSELKNSGFKIKRAESYSSGVEIGRVISQNPSAGETVPKGSEITVIVSIGMEGNKKEVPYLLGLDEMTATATIIEAGLHLKGVSYAANSEYAEGLVCYQSYSKGTFVEEGEGIEIIVSKGPESVTYRCNMSIEAPTVAEAPDYVAGSAVRITLVTDDGKILQDTTTSTFPKSANYYGLTAAGGTITFYYTVTVGGTTTIDPVTGETIIVPGTQETKSFDRRIEFVKE